MRLLQSVLPPILMTSILSAQLTTDGWIPLFNGRDLTGWYTYLPSSGRNKDPKGVFKVHDGMIHILDIPETGENQEMGYIATEKEYSDCRIRLEYKWGSKRFPPRAAAPRDSGLLYHFVGLDKVWPRSIECQIMEADTGSFYLVDKTGLTTTVISRDKPQFREGGVVFTEIGKGAGSILMSTDFEKPAEWNTVEVVLDRDHAVHWINGRINNLGWAIRQPDPANPARHIPLTRGRILLQAKSAEIFFRNVMWKPLDNGRKRETPPSPPRADHLPISSGLSCSAANDQPVASFKVALSAEQEARALQIYRRSVVILAHDHCLEPEDFRDMQAAGITVRTVKPTVDGAYFDHGRRFNLDTPVDGWFERGMLGLDLLDRRLAEARGQFLMVRTVADIQRARREGKCGIIYGFEGARAVAGDLGNLRKFYNRGLRELQLFWAVPSPLKRLDGSLTDFGVSVVSEANRLGILLDLSHMNDAAFRQVMGVSTRPVIVSHCGVAAVSGRKGGGTDQLNDETIKRIAVAGGVIGLHFYEGYITARHGEHSTVTDLVDHIAPIKQLVGIDYVALGADYFPESGWRWIEGAERMTGIPNVAREMVRRGYSDGEIEQVLGGNLIRLYGNVWKP